MTKSNFKYYISSTIAISKASFRAMLRNPTAIIFSLLFPMIFILVFGFLGNKKTNLKIAFSAQSDTSNAIYSSLKNLCSIKISDPTQNNTWDDFQKGRIHAIINIKKNTTPNYPPYRVELQTSKLNPTENKLLRLIIKDIAYAQKQASLAIIQEHKISFREYKKIDFILPGQLGFSLLASGVFGTAFVFLSLRITLVIKRFFATPIHRSSIIIGEALSRLVFSLLGAVVIIGIGHIFLGFTLINGWVTFLNMLLLSAIGLIVFMGFGFIISGIARSEQVVPPLANIVTMPQFLLSGTFFTIDTFPNWLQPICKIMPLTFLNDALRMVAFEGANLWDVKLQLLFLGLWGILVYTLAVKVFKWE